ncbi:MAG: hypothetical protein IH840_17465 [Candidatus Heimdallarchaeota archaeon]|nr:hypothetical protein [Candidatus Heimdallarchaeota archaeon]
MSHLIIHVTVDDYAHWRSIFDESEDRRKGIGSESELIFRNPDNLNQLTILFKWENEEKARTFGENPKLVDAMCAAGATSPPEIRLLNLTKSKTM